MWIEIVEKTKTEVPIMGSRLVRALWIEMLITGVNCSPTASRLVRALWIEIVIQ